MSSNTTDSKTQVSQPPTQDIATGQQMLPGAYQPMPPNMYYMQPAQYPQPNPVAPVMPYQGNYPYIYNNQYQVAPQQYPAYAPQQQYPAYVPQPQVVYATPRTQLLQPAQPQSEVKHTCSHVHVGPFTKFVKSLILSMFFPFFSLIIVFAMETSMMSRLGAIFGNVNMLLWLALYMISFGQFIWDECYRNYFYQNGGYYNNGGMPSSATQLHNCADDASGVYFISIPFFVLALITFIWALFYTKKVFAAYRSPEAAEERSAPVLPHQIGKAGDMVGGFLASFFFPFVGSFIVVIANRKVMARFGVILGIATLFLILGIVSSAFWFMSFITGNPTLLIGLSLLQCTSVYYKRVIESSKLISYQPM